jgi:hypothetical protein
MQAAYAVLQAGVAVTSTGRGKHGTQHYGSKMVQPSSCAGHDVLIIGIQAAEVLVDEIKRAWRFRPLLCCAGLIGRPPLGRPSLPTTTSCVLVQGTQ